MSPAFQLLPLLIILALYAAFFKLAARVLRVSQVGWLSAFQFAGLVVVVTMAGRLVSVYLGELPMLAAVVFGLGLHLAVGREQSLILTLGETLMSSSCATSRSRD